MDDFGQEVIQIGELSGWTPRDGPIGGPDPDAFVFDHAAGRPAFYLAGYYRGRGVPVVFVIDPGANVFRRFASRTGTLSVKGPDGFREWLATDPDYLRTGRPPAPRFGPQFQQTPPPRPRKEL